jgi:hypothetical protein
VAIRAPNEAAESLDSMPFQVAAVKEESELFHVLPKVLCACVMIDSLESML